MHPRIVTVADLVRAMDAGWELRESGYIRPCGLGTAQSVYTLHRSGQIRGELPSRTIIAAMRSKRIKLDEATVADKYAVWRLVKSQRSRKQGAA